MNDVAELDQRFVGMLDEMISNRISLRDCGQVLASPDPDHIKTVVEIEPW